MSAFNHLEFVKAHRFIAIDRCFIAGKVNRPTLTIGKEYAITISDEECFFVIDDEGDSHRFSWERYTEWFKAIPKEEQVDPLKIKDAQPTPQVKEDVPCVELFDTSEHHGVRTILFWIKGVQHTFVLDKEDGCVLYLTSNKTGKRLSVDLALKEIDNLILLKQEELSDLNMNIDRWNTAIKALEEKYGIN
jgi:hypothetical protein